MTKSLNGPIIIRDCDNGDVSPFLKWAGGKRWFVKNHRDMLPNNYGTYFEPFLGSGAVFFSLKPKKAVLADSNSALIETYQAIKDDWAKVWSILRRHQRNHSDEYYYQERGRQRKSRFERAAQFIYLNRTCYNGLYRVNLAGKFNVPRGTKDTVVFDTDNFSVVSDRLQCTELNYSDFEPIINRSKRGDLVFVDPPYTVKHNLNGFVKYNEKIFTWEDQVRLRDSVFRAKKRGAFVIVTNANHESIWDLYKGFGEYEVLDRYSVLAGDAAHRKSSSELIIVGSQK